jgi:hypothetical protein
MLREYFHIIRQALSENRVKNQGTYYEAHHIVPKSFSKQSTTVLLLPEEHYECHKLLAEYFRYHPMYGKKMLWAFHRLAYDKGRKLTAEEYAKARKILMTLWTEKKTDTHKQKIAASRKGKKTVVHPVTKEIKYCSIAELDYYLQQGWENTNYTKGTSSITEEGRKKLAEARKADQTGKIGDQAKASKGWVVCEYEDGRKVEAGSALQLSYLIEVCPATITNRLKSPDTFIKGYKIYYKNTLQ